MRVGISVLTHEGQSVWENGLGQNVLFLAQLLEQLPLVKEVLLLDCGNQDSYPDEMRVAQRFRLMKPKDATELVDVVIEMAGGLSVEWLDYVRARGVKVVFHCCGQPYVGLVEPVVFARGGYAARADRCDEIWVLSKDRGLSSMMAALHRCPVYVAPFIWKPDFVEARRVALEASGVEFGYRKPEDGAIRQPLSVAIFEPNISVVKCCAIPMLICEQVYRADPDAITAMHVLNSSHMAEHPTFNYLANSLDITKAGRSCFPGRHDFPGYMGQNANAVVSHQWNNEQNIVYLDALYGGYPLIHNSAWLGTDAGYFYPDFDASAGADRLLWAAYHHHEHLDAYRQQAHRFIERLAPDAAANLEAYAQLLLRLTSRTQERVA